MSDGIAHSNTQQPVEEITRISHEKIREGVWYLQHNLTYDYCDDATKSIGLRFTNKTPYQQIELIRLAERKGDAPIFHMITSLLQAALCATGDSELVRPLFLPKGMEISFNDEEAYENAKRSLPLMCAPNHVVSHKAAGLKMLGKIW